MSVTQKADIAGAQTTVIKPDIYDLMKKFVQIILPAFSALYLGLAQLWEWPEPEKVVGTVALITTFLGICLTISASRYSQSDAGTVGDFVVMEDGGGAAGYRLALNAEPEAMADQERITFRVQKTPV